MGDIRRLQNSSEGPTCTNDIIAMLEETIQDLRNGNIAEGQPFNKAVLLLLHDTPTKERKYPYDDYWRQVGMRMSECISLMRISEMSFLQHMGKAVLPEDLLEL